METALNKKELPPIKGWQAEAYIYSILFCCQVHKDHPPFELHLSKICALYDIYGDIFDMQIIKEMFHKVKNSTKPFDDFTTQLRLIPKEHQTEVYNDCVTILQKRIMYDDPKDPKALPLIERQRNDARKYLIKIMTILEAELT